MRQEPTAKHDLMTSFHDSERMRRGYRSKVLRTVDSQGPAAIEEASTALLEIQNASWFGRVHRIELVRRARSMLPVQVTSSSPTWVKATPVSGAALRSCFGLDRQPSAAVGSFPVEFSTQGLIGDREILLE